MIPDKDYYADKNGKLTNDPNEFAFQIALAGVNLDERVAKRYGIAHAPVVVAEPKRSKASLNIHKADEQKQESASVVDAKPETDEPEAEEPKAAASIPVAAKDEGVKKK